MKKHILVTGANGFVGRVVCEALLAKGYSVSGAVRRPETVPKGVAPRKIDDIGPKTDWVDALFTVDSVIHLAARVHVMNETAANPLAQFRTVNTQGTLQLAREAADHGVKRFIFISTIKVNGEATEGRPFHAADRPNPTDPYAQSKWEAEQGLWKISEETGMEVVVIRPPLVYGAGVKGNFKALLDLCAKGVPLPLKNVENSRALIFSRNLADAIVTCLTAPEAAGQTYLVKDSTEMSTGRLVERICQALGRKPRLIAVPSKVLGLAGRLTGKTKVLDRLLGSLSIDSGKIYDELGWTPPYTSERGLAETVRTYRRGKR